MNREMSFLAVGFVLFACATVANAELLTTDASFGNQSDGVTIKSPWNNPATQTTGSTASQSPFTYTDSTTFPGNGMGAYWAASSTTTPYFAQVLGTAIAADATGLRYMNADFMLPTSGSGGFQLCVAGSSYFAQRAFSFLVNGSGLYATSGTGAGTKLLTTEVGVWYNVSLTLDMTNNSYSGTITREGTFAQTAISSRAFATENAITQIYSDTQGAAGMGLPQGNLGARVDNWALSDTVLPSVLIPEPNAVILLCTGMLGLLAYAWRKRK